MKLINWILKHFSPPHNDAWSKPNEFQMPIVPPGVKTPEPKFRKIKKLS